MEFFFSIVIPTYNRAYIIHETLQIILAQTFNNFEIIVVDDGSTDNTKEVLDSFMKTSPNIRYFYKENGERGAARNYGRKHAAGKYVVFFDSDDFMLPEHLITLHNKILNLKEAVDFIATKYNFALPDGSQSTSAIQPFSEGWYDYSTFLNGNHLACNFCIKRDNPNLILFEEDRNYAILEDWMFLLENLKNNRIFLIDKITIQMRKHDDRSMGDHQTIIKRRIKANERLLNKVSLTQKEATFMTAHSYYFCAIHAYLDNQKKQSFTLLKKAISLTGFEYKFMILLAKLIVGKKMITLIKR